MSIQTMMKNLNNHIVMSAGIISYMVLLLMRIPLANIIGDAGMGLFAPAFELFILITLITSYSISRSMSGLIRYRVKRERYRNAGKVFRAAFFLDLIISVIVAVLLLFMASFIADILVLEHLSRMAILAAAPAVVFAAFIGTFRGYFNGYGLGVLVAHSQYIEKISMVVCVLLCSKAFQEYGENVAALLQEESYAYAYGALGAMLGVVASQMITTVYLLVIYAVYSVTLRGRLGQDMGKRLETQYSIQKMILSGLLPLCLITVFSNLYMLVDQRFFNYCMNMTGQGDVRTRQWGSYYGRFAVMIGLGTAVCCMVIHPMIAKVSGYYDREEYRPMRERIAKAVKKLSITAFPIMVYLAVLSASLIRLSYGKRAASIAAKEACKLLTSAMQEGAVIIVLFGFSFLFAQLLYKLNMVRELFFTVIISFAVHLLTGYLLVHKLLMGINGLLGSLILMFGVYASLSFVLVSRRIRYRQDWFSGVVFPAVAAGVSGVVVFLLRLVLVESAGDLITVLVASLSGVFVYIFLLMALRVIGEAELTRMPLGFFFILLGKNLGIL